MIGNRTGRKTDLMENDGGKKVVDQERFTDRFQVIIGHDVREQDNDVVVRTVIERTSNGLEPANHDQQCTETEKRSK